MMIFQTIPIVILTHYCVALIQFYIIGGDTKVVVTFDFFALTFCRPTSYTQVQKSALANS